MPTRPLPLSAPASDAAAVDADLGALLAQLAKIPAVDKIGPASATTSASEPCANDGFPQEGPRQPVQASDRSLSSPLKKTRGKGKACTSISAENALNLLNGFAFAEARRTPMNAAFTIAFVGSRFYPQGAGTKDVTAECRRRLLLLLGDFATANGFEATFVYGLENPPTGGTGLHAHVLMHLPQHQHRPLLAALESKLRGTFRWGPRAGSFEELLIQPHRVDYADAFRSTHYFLKGIDPGVTTYRRTNGEGPSPQGRIHGKRIGCSQNIDQAARQRAGHADAMTVDDLDANRHLNAWRQRIRGEIAKYLKSLGPNWGRLNNKSAVTNRLSDENQPNESLPSITEEDANFTRDVLDDRYAGNRFRRSRRPALSRRRKNHRPAMSCSRHGGPDHRAPGQGHDHHDPGRQRRRGGRAVIRPFGEVRSTGPPGRLRARWCWSATPGADRPPEPCAGPAEASQEAAGRPAGILFPHRETTRLPQPRGLFASRIVRPHEGGPEP